MTSVLLNEIYQSDIRNVTNLDIDWNRLYGKTLLITGATGMIASALIDILMCKNQNIQGRDGIHIIAVSRNEGMARERFATYWNSEFFSYLSHDITMPLPELGNVSYILHAASNTHPRAYAMDPIGTITANVEGTHQLLEYAAGHMCECFFFFSSVEIYGENRKDTEQFDENYLGYIDCNTVRAGYPESKRLGETLCNAYATQKGQDFVIGRFSRAYGPTMQERDSKAIAQFIKKAVAGEDIVLKSEGTQVYSYTYVVDAAAAILYLLLYAKSGDAINIADRKSDISLREIARILAEIAHTNVIFEQPDELERKGYSTATRATLNPERMENMGWVAKTDIREGLKKTVECLKNWQSFS
ncbi:MAG: NAD-dependent epimerase/dehydratase family protein [Lachnospiraceae bacterium]|nr:NAD-dependent epimerase/dehydratase family protein [Lachnospiraceae bacterium]